MVRVTFTFSSDLALLSKLSLTYLMNVSEIKSIFLNIGFEKPSAIQQRAIAPVIKGRDVIAQALSGTGKTATFSISILQALDIQTRETLVLVLSPTRELAVQIQKV